MCSGCRIFLKSKFEIRCLALSSRFQQRIQRKFLGFPDLATAWCTEKTLQFDILLVWYLAIIFPLARVYLAPGMEKDYKMIEVD